MFHTKSGFSNLLKFYKHVVVRKTHANNMLVLEVDIVKGSGTQVWDKCGKEFLDFLAGQGSVIAGHCHPKLVGAVQDQLCNLHLTSRHLLSGVLDSFSCRICQMYKYEKVLSCVSGSEAVEAALKISRRWGYICKKICPKDAIVVYPFSGYSGCSLSGISATDIPLYFTGFEPLLKGLKLIPYNDICSLEEILQEKTTAAIVLEPSQVIGGSGNMPLFGYLTEVRKMCTKYNVLWVSNEVLTGVGRTGALSASECECVKPDIMVLGKGLSGGMYPSSAVLCAGELMDLLTPGSHQSCYAGSPVAAAACNAALKVVEEECLCDNAKKMGDLMRDGLLCMLTRDDMPEMRCKGLLFSFKIDPRIGSKKDIVFNLAECGLITWPDYQDDFLKLTPPLNLCEEDVTKALSIIKKILDFMKGCHKIC